MVVGLLAMLFVVLMAYIAVARSDQLTLTSVQKGKEVRAVVIDVNDLIYSEIAATRYETFGRAYADIAGYGQTKWLSSSQPVLIPDGYLFDAPQYVQDDNPAELGVYEGLLRVRFPALSQFAGGTRGTGTLGHSLVQLLRNYDQEGSDDNGISEADVDRSALSAFMDAAGVGFPDCSLVATAALTAFANQVGGTPVRVPLAIQEDFSLNSGQGDPLWQRFKEQASFEVAGRVVSHGGMVSIGAGYDGSPSEWFARSMFGWLADGLTLGGATLGDPNDQYAALFEDAENVEPWLRRRGGLVYGSDDNRSSRVPAVLSELEWDQDLEAIFAPPYRARGSQVNKDNERYNIHQDAVIGSGRQFEYWTEAAALDAPAYNTMANGGPIESYNRRQLLTTVSYSDEICRKLDDDLPLGTKQGVFEGQIKFYLGDVSTAFNATTGNYVPAVGEPIIKRLANYYYDMLSGHAGWAGESAATEIVTRQQQAYMLAINTVASAAPYVNGTIDAVRYDTTRERFFGYAPQPFITQVGAFLADVDPNKDATTYELSLAVEFFNPYDRELNLGQYEVSFDSNEPGVDGPLDSHAISAAGVKIAPRSFYVVAFSNVVNTAFADNLGTTSGAPDYEETGLTAAQWAAIGPQRVKVWLWREGSVGGQYLVDRLEVDYPTSTEDTTDLKDLHGDWETAYRDTTAEDYLGGPVGSPTRWRTAIAFQPVPVGGTGSPDARYGAMSGDHDGLGEELKPAIGIEGPGVTNKARAVPLYTVNPKLNPLAPGGALFTMHAGDYRPKAYPTVGWMALIPRYAHGRGKFTGGDGTQSTGWRSVSMTLRDEWVRKGYDGVPVVPDAAQVPLDFGHMPLFDNKQPAVTGGLFTDDNAGRVPWGQLVFDYFTTILPVYPGVDETYGTADDIETDYYRIPGRININTAPWYVLAGLPLLNPVGDLSAAGASPAFWDVNSGVFVGLDANGAPRCMLRNADDTYLPDVRGYVADSQPKTHPHVWNHPTDTTYDTYRLGAWLGQAIAAYRDKTPYYEGGSLGGGPVIEQIYTNAHARPWYGNPAVYGEHTPRGIGTDEHLGFLTVGELLNVKGFDSTWFDKDGLPVVDVLSAVHRGDFLRSINLLLLLDTHYLTTRSNTFTVYSTVFDRDTPESSVHTQATIDCSRMLPRLVLDSNGDPLLEDSNGNGTIDSAVILRQDNARPEIIAERRGGYFDTTFEK